MVKKKGKTASSSEAVPSSFSFAADEDAKARMKLQILSMDYEELLKDTEARRLRLEKARETKLKLSAHVKFLRKKYNQFMINPSHGTQYRLKKKSRKIPSLSSNRALHGSIMSSREAAPLKDSSYPYRGRSEAGKKSSMVLDLNQAFLPNGEDMEEFHVQVEQGDKSRRFDGGEEAAGCDLKLSTYRGSGGSGNRVGGKKKITWQDQVALRV